MTSTRIPQKEERLTVIKNVRAPYDEVGTLEAAWYPLALGAEGKTVDPEADDSGDIELPEIDSPQVITKEKKCSTARSCPAFGDALATIIIIYALFERAKILRDLCTCLSSIVR